MSEPKDEVYFKICDAVLKLETFKGNYKWNISEVAKEADVTRSLIYYYFGKEKEIILSEAYRYMVSIIFDDARKLDDELIPRFINTVNTIRKMPYVLFHFYLHRGKDTLLGNLIDKAEDRLYQYLTEKFEHMTLEDARTFYTYELGIVFDKKLNDADIKKYLLHYIDQFQKTSN